MAISLSSPYRPRTEPLVPGQGIGRLPTQPGGYDSSGINPNGMYTGGNLPATQLPLNTPMQTGGNLPAQQVPGAPAPVGTPPAGVPGAPAPVPAAGAPAAKANFDINSILQSMWNANGGNAPQVDPAQLANQYMASILDPNNPYIASARQHGVEQANGRGLLNSSIAAGASQRAAIDAAQPMFQQAYGLHSQREQNQFQGALSRTQLGMGLLGQRENNAFQGDQAQRDRALKIKLQSDSAFQQDWLANKDFTRQFNAALSMIPIQSANQFMQNIQQYAIENPEIYTPEMINGMQNFFSQSMATLLAKYFPKGGTS